MKRKPDNRKDNVAKIQRNINNTISNMEVAEDMMQNSNDKTKKELKDKNDRRQDALNGLRLEIKDEANHQKNKDK